MSKRTELCASLVRNGARTIRDGNAHDDKVNRCVTASGLVGYYEVLSDYDEATDTFGTGWEKRVPAKQVDEVAVFDTIQQAIAILKGCHENQTR